MSLERARTLFSEGLDLLTREDYASAERKLREAHLLVPDRVSVLTNLSAALLRQDKLAEAKQHAQRSVDLDSSNAEGWLNLSYCLRKEREMAAALECCERSTALKPGYAEAWSNRAALLLDLERHGEALASCEKAIAARSNYAEAWSNRGLALNALQRSEEALASFDQAIAAAPDQAAGWANRAVTLGDLYRYDESLASYEKAVALKPTPYLPGDWLRARMQVCHWDAFPAACERVLAGVEAGAKVANPLSLLAIRSSPAQQRRCAEIYVRDLYPANASLGPHRARSAHPRIRLGYFSRDFRNHATAYLMAGLFERHDRSKLELHAFSFGPPAKDAMRQRLQAAFENFHDVDREADQEIAALARRLEIDIAVDLKGLSGYARPGIFAARAAPVQVNYMGYPGTMGADYIDYLIADRIVVPPEDLPHYSEKVAWLPHTYWVNDSQRRISSRPMTRADAGLPAGFVFCCFNNPAKITPDVFDLWMRLVRRVEGSVLWLLDHNPGATRNLRAEAAKRGVSPARLIFARPMEQAEHLARHRLADLLVDTFYYNAHTTASDALWAGLPVVTCPGSSFASRVAASLLRAVGLPELIANSSDAYESLALSLALKPDRLAAVRQKLAGNLLTHPLFDTGLFARHMEAAYAQIWQRHCAGLPPEHIQVPA